jgi:hypothetical protein
MSFDLVESNGVDYDEWTDYRTAVTLNPYGSENGNTSSFLRISPKGCRIGDGWDCTAACLNTTTGPAMVWGNADKSSMFTLANCVVLPVIAALLAGAGGNLTSDGITMAEKYKIDANADLIGSPNTGWPVINNCINAYCGMGDPPTPGCKTVDNPDVFEYYTLFPNVSYWDDKYQDDEDGNYWWPINSTFNGTAFNSGLCHNLSALINPDIGGIGVSKDSLNGLSPKY